MLSSYTVLDLRPYASGHAPSRVVDAHSPEDAATRALGLDLVRTGQPGTLQAKVYIQSAGRRDITVRLYTKSHIGAL